jgi:hypothetical protein
MTRADVVEHLGKKNLVANMQDALKRAHEIDAGPGDMGANLVSRELNVTPGQ